ncbi:MAG: YitT family protein [Clostridia bacterium]
MKKHEIIKDKNKTKIVLEMVTDLILIALGAYFISLGINMFLLPHKMTTGGASGIATLLYYIFNIPFGVTVLIINAPLLISSIFKLGIKSSVKSIISIILLSIFLEVFNYNLIARTTNIDLFVSCIFGGLIVGIGSSLTLKAGASSGGSDLLAQLIYKATSAQSLSQILLIIEVFIISGIIIVFKDINIGLYSIIALYISTKVIDIIFEGIYYTKVVNIITKKQKKITEKILIDLKRGATITTSIGAHTGDSVTTILCLVTRPQIAKLKKIVKDCDNDAIMYITTSNEVIGKGFKQY